MVDKAIYSTVKRQRWLDGIAEAVQKSVQSTVQNGGAPARDAKDFLHGVWLRHPLHAALTDVPIGSWTAAMVLDAIADGKGGHLQRAADAAVAVGLLGSIPTALAGLADWSDLYGERRRVGTAHALSNVAAVTLFGLSFLRRQTRERSGARFFATLGYLSVTLGAWLGGELVYKLGVQIDRNAWSGGPKQFTPVLDETELAEDQPRRVMVDGAAVLLVRHEGRLTAFGETCCHAGGPLAEGKIENDTIVCPWHGSAFSLADGAPVHGPAVYAQPPYDVRVREGKIEVKRASV